MNRNGCTWTAWTQWSHLNIHSSISIRSMAQLPNQSQSACMSYRQVDWHPLRSAWRDVKPNTRVCSSWLACVLFFYRTINSADEWTTCIFMLTILKKTCIMYTGTMYRIYRFYSP